MTFLTNLQRAVVLGKTLPMEGFFLFAVVRPQLHSSLHSYRHSLKNQEVLLSDSAVGNGGFHVEHGQNFPTWVFKPISCCSLVSDWNSLSARTTLVFVDRCKRLQLESFVAGTK